MDHLWIICVIPSVNHLNNSICWTQMSSASSRKTQSYLHQQEKERKVTSKKTYIPYSPYIYHISNQSSAIRCLFFPGWPVGGTSSGSGTSSTAPRPPTGGAQRFGDEANDGENGELTMNEPSNLGTKLDLIILSKKKCKMIGWLFFRGALSKKDGFHPQKASHNPPSMVISDKLEWLETNFSTTTSFSKRMIQHDHPSSYWSDASSVI